MAYIRRYYGVPARRGGRVRYASAFLGTITGSRQQHLRVRLDGKRRSEFFHPTWLIEYLESSGVDR